MKPYFQTDNAKLYQGDCLEVMARLPDSSFDAIICDPPYGTTACKWDSVIPFAPMWEQLKRLIKPRGAIVLFGSEPFSSLLRCSNLKDFKYDWIWSKNRPSGLASAKYRPMINHEMISVFGNASIYNPIKEERDLKAKYASIKEGKSSRRGYGSETQNMKATESKVLDALRHPTTVREFDSVSNHAGRFHPTQKPVALMEYLIKTYTNEGQRVLDFTAGSGSTLVGAINTGRQCAGIEQSEEYCAIASKRLTEATEAQRMNLWANEPLTVEPARQLEMVA